MIAPQDCKEARRKLGLSAAGMALALGLTDGRAVRRYEAPAGSRTARCPQGPLAVLYRLILAGALRAEDLLDPPAPSGAPCAAEAPAGRRPEN